MEEHSSPQPNSEVPDTAPIQGSASGPHTTKFIPRVQSTYPSSNHGYLFGWTPREGGTTGKNSVGTWKFRISVHERKLHQRQIKLRNNATFVCDRRLNPNYILQRITNDTAPLFRLRSLPMDIPKNKSSLYNGTLKYSVKTVGQGKEENKQTGPQLDIHIVRERYIITVHLNNLKRQCDR